MNKWMMIAACAASLSVAAAERKSEEVLVRGPYVQLATPNAITVVWRTRGSVEPGVWFGEDPARLERLAAPGTIAVRRGAASGEVAMAGLVISAPRDVTRAAGDSDGAT